VSTLRERRHLPGKEAWLIGDWRSSGERKFHLSNQPSGTSLRTLAATIEAHWVTSQGGGVARMALRLAIVSASAVTNFAEPAPA